MCIGTVGQKTSAEAMITLIACCLGLLSGRGIGYLLHETSSRSIPLYHVSLVLSANGLSLLLCCTTDEFAKILLFFGCYGFLWGKLLFIFLCKYILTTQNANNINLKDIQ